MDLENHNSNNPNAGNVFLRSLHGQLTQTINRRLKSKNSYTRFMVLDIKLCFLLMKRTGTKTL